MEYNARGIAALAVKPPPPSKADIYTSARAIHSHGEPTPIHRYSSFVQSRPSVYLGGPETDACRGQARTRRCLLLGVLIVGLVLWFRFSKEKINTESCHLLLDEKGSNGS